MVVPYGKRSQRFSFFFIMVMLLECSVLRGIILPTLIQPSTLFINNGSACPLYNHRKKTLTVTHKRLFFSLHIPDKVIDIQKSPNCRSTFKIVFTSPCQDYFQLQSAKWSMCSSKISEDQNSYTIWLYLSSGWTSQHWLDALEKTAEHKEESVQLSLAHCPFSAYR